MIRATTIGALVLAMGVAPAALAQQASGQATGSAGVSAGDTAGDSAGEGAAGVGAPAEEATGIKGVYATKRMMGISTGQMASPDDADASAQAERADDGDRQPSE